MGLYAHLDELSWFWIGVMVAAPTVIGMLAAFPFWRKNQMIFGNVVGTAVIFGTAIGLILRESAALDRIIQACLDDGLPCFPEPTAFTRFAIYAFIALLEVMTLFAVSLKIEESLRQRDYAPEWR